MKKRFFYFTASLFVMIVTFILGNAVINYAETPPSGSYSKTCKDASYDGSTLTAKCKKLNGQYAGSNTTLTGADTCTGDRENCNGTLKCTGEDLPSGNYKNSCFCCYKKGKYDSSKEREVENVCCYCKSSSGSYSSETCTTAECASPKQIQNINGTLTCK
jgi:hypothetical protein